MTRFDLRLRRREGSAAIAMVLGLLLLELAIGGLLFVCTQEAIIARAFAERFRLRAAAESAVDAALASWPADSLRILPPGGRLGPVAATGILHGGAHYMADVERLHGSWFLVRGKGVAGSGSATAEAAALVSMYETAPFWRDFASPVVSGGAVQLLAGSVLDAAAADAVPAPWSLATCPANATQDMVATLGTLQPPALIVAQLTDAIVDPGAVMTGSVAITQDSTLSAASFDTVGPVVVAELGTIAERIESGSITLAPAAVAGGCDGAAAGNWGSPSDPAHPCADYVPLVYAPGDLEVVSGEGQALLVVGGHLRLHPGVRLVGAVLAIGGLTANGAEVLGAVRLGAAASTLTGIFRYNACALWRAFTRPAALRVPTRRSEHWWLPVF